jgi:Penicillin-binding protein 5, C-terminal domain
VIADTTVRKVKRVTEHFTYATQIPKDVAGPIHYGQQIGKLLVKLRGRTVATVPLTAALEIPKATAARRTQNFLTQPWTLIVLGVILVGAALLSQRRTPPRRTRESSGVAE